MAQEISCHIPKVANVNCIHQLRIVFLLHASVEYNDITLINENKKDTTASLYRLYYQNLQVCSFEHI